VLKLIYHTPVFGPIDLEYDRPVIRVGRSEDNDLVLRQPSVEPHHCLLVFRDEKLLCLPASQDIPSATDLGDLAGPELGLGDQITIGELQFSLAHSSRTVVIPKIQSAGPAPEPSQEGCYCAHCRTFIGPAEVKRVGLVGHAAHSLCPRCSRPLDSDPEPREPLPTPIEPSRKPWRPWKVLGS